jgi:hypothetical protein
MKKQILLLYLTVLCCSSVSSQVWNHPLFTIRIESSAARPGGDGGKGIDESMSRIVGSYIHHSSASFSPDNHPARVSFSVKTYKHHEEGERALAKTFVDSRLRRDSTARVVDTFKTDNGLVVVELYRVWSGVSPMGTPFSHEVMNWYIQGKNRVYHFDLFSEFDDRFYQSRLDEFRHYIRTFKEK